MPKAFFNPGKRENTGLRLIENGRRKRGEYTMVTRNFSNVDSDAFQLASNDLFMKNRALIREDKDNQSTSCQDMVWDANVGSRPDRCVFCHIANCDGPMNKRKKVHKKTLFGNGKIQYVRKATFCKEAALLKPSKPAIVTVELLNGERRQSISIDRVQVDNRFKSIVKASRLESTFVYPGARTEVGFIINKNDLDFGFWTIPFTMKYYKGPGDHVHSSQLELKVLVSASLIEDTVRFSRPVVRRKALPTNTIVRKDVEELSLLSMFNGRSDDEDEAEDSGGDGSGTEDNRQSLKKPYLSKAPMLKQRLPQYHMPEVFDTFGRVGGRRNVLDKDELEEIVEYEQLLASELTRDNYRDKFCALLHLEEYHESKELSEFNMFAIRLTKTSFQEDIFMLEIGDGLADGRPSLMLSDVVVAKLKTPFKLKEPVEEEEEETGSRKNKGKKEDKKPKADKNKFWGYITHVGEKTVNVLFDKHLTKNFQPSMLFDVEFMLNRFQHRLCHRAVEMMDNHSRYLNILIPETSFPFIIPKMRVRFLSADISSNPQQVQAITNIVNKSSLPFPYVVFGPPGTGKTKTLVESVLLNWELDPHNRRKQLICSTSNATVDLIVEQLLKLAQDKNDRLKFVPSENILRMYSKSVPYEHASETIKKEGIHNYDSYGEAFVPSNEFILKMPIIAGTLITGAKIASIGIPKGHFSHVFIDECGHCSEPESLMAIAGIVTNKKPRIATQLVLVGDPQQLGATIRCSLLEKYRFDYSLLERLINTVKMYGRDPETKAYNAEVLTKLTKNFRSHKAILTIPNKLFYHDELEVAGDERIINMCAKMELLPKMDFPVIFHGVMGLEERDKTSPSYFNLSEVGQIVAYVQNLVGKQKKGKVITPDDIGVVTPYKKQVQKLEAAFKAKNWANIMVGSVDVFQGSEKLIVLISTVRSFKAADKAGASASSSSCRELRFLNDYKRFNVALTRAKALLIVVGNPNVLEHQSHWKIFMDYCLHNGSYAGALPETYVSHYGIAECKVDTLPPQGKANHLRENDSVQAGRRDSTRKAGSDANKVPSNVSEAVQSATRIERPASKEIKLEKGNRPASESDRGDTDCRQGGSRRVDDCPPIVGNLESTKMITKGPESSNVGRPRGKGNFPVNKKDVRANASVEGYDGCSSCSSSESAFEMKASKRTPIRYFDDSGVEHIKNKVAYKNYRYSQNTTAIIEPDFVNSQGCSVSKSYDALAKVRNWLDDEKEPLTPSKKKEKIKVHAQVNKSPIPIADDFQKEKIKVHTQVNKSQIPVADYYLQNLLLALEEQLASDSSTLDDEQSYKDSRNVNTTASTSTYEDAWERDMPEDAYENVSKVDLLPPEHTYVTHLPSISTSEIRGHGMYENAPAEIPSSQPSNSESKSIYENSFKAGSSLKSSIDSFEAALENSSKGDLPSEPETERQGMYENASLENQIPQATCEDILHTISKSVCESLSETGLSSQLKLDLSEAVQRHSAEVDLSSDPPSISVSEDLTESSPSLKPNAGISDAAENTADAMEAALPPPPVNATEQQVETKSRTELLQQVTDENAPSTTNLQPKSTEENVSKTKSTYGNTSDMDLLPKSMYENTSKIETSNYSIGDELNDDACRDLSSDSSDCIGNCNDGTSESSVSSVSIRVEEKSGMNGNYVDNNNLLSTTSADNSSRKLPEENQRKGSVSQEDQYNCCLS